MLASSYRNSNTNDDSDSSAPLDRPHMRQMSALNEDQQQQQQQPAAGSSLHATMSSSTATTSGGRVLKLQQAFHKALGKCADACTVDQFLQCFPEDYANLHASLLAEVYELFIDSFKKNAENEFMLICDEWQLESKLNAIDAACKQQQEIDFSSAVISLHQGPTPEQQLRSQLVASKVRHKANLQHILAQLEEENKALEERLMQQRIKVGEARSAIAQHSQALHKAANIISEQHPSAEVSNTTDAVLNALLQ